eukprot:CAMPEP_0175342082 /NCGR_PEP_ID=MMETSP0095-20121207/6669_1 /TAXON_ID=311494 /ORGANISM="Alexandrium monilatum, Strain CCMP3105" /LENGTH=129 /DNA_ID=CAMNT_0016639509 /DNA_START=73 /DNA_END=459 /DNA_ORIENTATION=-
MVFSRLEQRFTSIVAVHPAGIQTRAQVSTRLSQPAKNPRCQGECIARSEGSLKQRGINNSRAAFTITSPSSSCAFCSCNRPRSPFKNFSTKKAPQQLKQMEMSVSTTPTTSMPRPVGLASASFFMRTSA